MEKPDLKTVLKFIIVAAVFGVVAAFGFDIAMRIITREKTVVLVPDVTKLSLSDAMDVVQEKGLIVLKVRQYLSDEAIPAGSVVKQNPVSGSVVKKGRAVNLTLSEGGKLVYVPEVKEKTLQEAEILFSRANLTVGNISEIYSDQIKMDIIISQEPEAGNIVKPETLINISVSRGPASLMGFLVMPYMVGKSSAQAESILEDIGYEISESEVVLNNNVPPGTVIKQEPAPGEMLGHDSYVKLFISQLSSEEKIKRTVSVFYAVPQDIMERNVRIVVRDAVSRRTVYENIESPGNKISFDIEVIGKAYILYYLDDVPVKRTDL